MYSHCLICVSLEGFPCGSAGKESTCNAGSLGSIPGLERSPGERLPTPVFWPGEFHGLYNQSMGSKESDTTEQRSLSEAFVGFPYSSVDKIHLQCRRPQLDSWVGKIHWRRDKLPTQYFVLENSRTNSRTIQSMGSQRDRHD